MGKSSDDKRPQVTATREGLEEVRRRIATVAEETLCKLRANGDPSVKVRQGGSNGTSGGANGKGQAGREPPDAATAVYLRRFLAGVMAKTESMCKMTDFEQQNEAEELVEEILGLYEDMEQTTSRLAATRARVARLGLKTCTETLRVSKTIDDRTAAALEPSNDRPASNGLPPPPGGDALDAGISGLEAGVLEPKVSMLIGAIAELPGPLKAVLQELPELTSSLATTVESVEAALGLRESQTEALLNKAPPTPLARKRGGLGGVGGERHQPPPEVVRGNARQARVEQARLERAASGAGRLGQICSG